MKASKHSSLSFKTSGQSRNIIPAVIPPIGWKRLLQKRERQICAWTPLGLKVCIRIKFTLRISAMAVQSSFVSKPAGNSFRCHGRNDCKTVKPGPWCLSVPLIKTLTLSQVSDCDIATAEGDCIPQRITFVFEGRA